MTNYDAALANCRRVELATYQSLTNDPQFIFPKIPVVSYDMRCTITRKDLQHLESSLEVYWKDEECGFSDQAKLTSENDEGSCVELYFIFEKETTFRVDPVRIKGEFDFEILINSCSPEYAYQKMALVLSEGNINERPENPAEAFDLYKILCNQNAMNAYGSIDYNGFINLLYKSLKIDGNDVEAIGIKTNFSIVIPTYNTEPNYLNECINSIRQQSYPHWEICIADDASSSLQTKEVLRELEASIPNEKFKIKYRSSNGHICRASNDAIEMASGDFLVFVDHDDVLHSDALYWIAKCIDENPDVNLVYTDEDKLCSETNELKDPHFKPSFNLNLLLSYNYICHLSAYRRSLVNKINGFRIGHEGSQDYDLALRVIADSKREQIAHIPIPLYHWRVHSRSTASHAIAKDYTSESGLLALNDFLANYKLNQQSLKNPTVNLLRPNRYRVSWTLDKVKQPSVDIIIPTKDKSEILKLAVESIFEKTSYFNYKITIVNNQSNEQETFDLFANLEKKYGTQLRILNYDNSFNYSAINNYAVKQSSAELIALVNNDVEVISPDWLSEMVSLAIQDDVGCVGAKLYYPDGTIQHAGVVVGLGGVAGHSHKYFAKEELGYMERLVFPQETSAVTAACLLVKRSVFELVNGLDEENLKVSFNDVDFCLRVHQAGFRNIWTPFAELYHHESVSRGIEDSPEKIARFNAEADYMKKMWAMYDANYIPICPHYSPCLTAAAENFSISSSLSYTLNLIKGMPFRVDTTNYYQILGSASITSRMN